MRSRRFRQYKSGSGCPLRTVFLKKDTQPPHDHHPPSVPRSFFSVAIHDRLPPRDVSALIILCVFLCKNVQISLDDVFGVHRFDAR